MRTPAEALTPPVTVGEFSTGASWVIWALTDFAIALVSEYPWQPIWNFVELGWPFTESAADGGRRFLPDELRERFNLRSVCAWDDTPSAESGTEFASDAPRIEISAIE